MFKIVQNKKNICTIVLFCYDSNGNYHIYLGLRLWLTLTLPKPYLNVLEV